MNRCCCIVAGSQLLGQSSHLQARKWQTSAADCLVMARKTYTRNMPLDHTLGARGSTVGDSEVDVDMVAVAVASTEPAGLAGLEEVASIVHVVEMCYLEAWVEEGASANRRVLV